MNLELDGRVVLVTGSSRGIGRATAIQFGAERARVIVTYVNNRDQAETAATAVREAGGEALVERLDLAAPETAREVARVAVEKWGRIDVLVNNAVDFPPVSTAYKGPFEDHPSEEWQSLIRTNFEGTYSVIQAVLPSMRAGKWGRIATISSVAADGWPGFGWYSAVKSGLHGLMRTLARELGPEGILANVVVAGPTLTERIRKNLPADLLASQAATLPIRRLATPEEVASTVVYLCSGANRIVTGEVIRASGGS